jgi:hypothetical protein
MAPNKKTSSRAIFALAILISSLYGLHPIQTSTADPVAVIQIPTIHITSPRASEVYPANGTPLTFWGDGYSWAIEYSNIECWLDGKVIERLDNYEAAKHISIVLNGLAEGRHTITVTATATVKVESSYRIIIDWTGPVKIRGSTVAFTVDNTGPTLTFVTPQNKTFNTAYVELNFTTEEPVNKLIYSLDKQSNGTLTDSLNSILAGNLVMTHIYGKDNYQITLSHLAEGIHNLKVYACDAVGNLGETENYQFTVNTQPPPTLLPSPTQTPTTQPTTPPSASTRSTQTPNNKETPSPTPTTPPTTPETQTPTPTPTPNKQFLSQTNLILIAVLSAFLITVAVATALLDHKTKQQPTNKNI